MARLPLVPLAALFAGSVAVLGLFVARGFVLREHARIMLGALALIWLIGSAWTVAGAAERAGGLRQLGIGGLVLVVFGSLVAVFFPAVALALWTHTPLY